MKFTIFALVIFLLGCSTEGDGLGMQPQRLPAPQVDAGAAADVLVAQDIQPGKTWTNSIAVGTGFSGDGGVGPAPDYYQLHAPGDTLIGMGSTFSLATTGGTLYFQLTSAADIAGRAVVIYAAETDPASAAARILGGSDGPVSGHVVIGRFSPRADPDQPLGTHLYAACLTSSDQSMVGWNIGMVCTYIAAAQVTVTK